MHGLWKYYIYILMFKREYQYLHSSISLRVICGQVLMMVQLGEGDALLA